MSFHRKSVANVKIKCFKFSTLPFCKTRTIYSLKFNKHSNAFLFITISYNKRNRIRHNLKQIIQGKNAGIIHFSCWEKDKIRQSEKPLPDTSAKVEYFGMRAILRSRRTLPLLLPPRFPLPPGSGLHSINFKVFRDDEKNTDE